MYTLHLDVFPTLVSHHLEAVCGIVCMEHRCYMYTGVQTVIN